MAAGASGIAWQMGYDLARPNRTCCTHLESLAWQPGGVVRTFHMNVGCRRVSMRLFGISGWADDSWHALGLLASSCPPAVEKEHDFNMGL